MSSANAEVPYGTLDLLILKTLETMGPLNGYRIARRIEQTVREPPSAEPGSDLPGFAPPAAERMD